MRARLREKRRVVKEEGMKYKWTPGQTVVSGKVSEVNSINNSKSRVR